uniref:Uncharacterized protein n=1 Tax=Oryza punctata TaxID=4537 RepID=A0A0E0M4P6_ORYPU
MALLAVNTYYVHDEVQVGEEAGEALLGVADDDGVDGAGALDPAWERVPVDARDDAGPRDHHGDAVPAAARGGAGAGDELLLKHHLSHGLGEDVGVGPTEVARPLQPEILHRLPLGLGVAGVLQLLPLLADKPELRLDVQLTRGHVEKHLEICALLSKLAQA